MPPDYLASQEGHGDGHGTCSTKSCSTWSDYVQTQGITPKPGGHQLQSPSKNQIGITQNPTCTDSYSYSKCWGKPWKGYKHIEYPTMQLSTNSSPPHNMVGLVEDQHKML